MDFRPVEIGTILRLLIFFTARPSYAVDIIELWDSTKTSNNLYEWKEYLKTCEIREVCPKDSEQCMGDKILWEDLGIQLQNSTEIVIMDDKNFQEAKVNFSLQQNDLDELTRHICDMTLIQKHAKGCLLLWIPNQCPWESVTDEEANEYTKDCEVKTIGEEDPRFAPKSCAGGPRWMKRIS